PVPHPQNGKYSSLSPVNMCVAVSNCLLLFKSMLCCALFLALLSAGRSIAARMAMMAITTRSSISVNASIFRKRVIGFIFGLQRKQNTINDKYQENITKFQAPQMGSFAAHQIFRGK